MDRIRVVSFNVNGVNKLDTDPMTSNFIHASAIVCLQETWDVEDAFVLQGFSKYSVAATRSSNQGRPSAGTATFISNSIFGNCRQSRIPSRYDWVIPVFIEDVDSGVSLLVVNIYVPRSVHQAN